MKKGCIIFIVFVCTSLQLTTNAYADGGFFISYENVNTDEVDNDSMGGQQAFLLKSPDTFTMYLQSSVKGNLEDFSWVLPLPVVPDSVDEAPKHLFQLLNDITAPHIVQYEKVEHDSESGGGCLGSFGSSDSLSSAGDEQNAVNEDMDKGLVEVLDSGVVGEFSYEIIKSEEEDALLMWLDKNGYYLPDNATDIIEQYVEDEFVFLAAKVRRDLPEGAKVNSLPAMAIQFPVDTEMVFPMRITSLSTQSKVPVLIYAATKEEVPIFSPDTKWIETNNPISVCTADEYKVAVQDKIDEKSNVFVLQSKQFFATSYEGKDWESYSWRELPSYFLIHSPNWTVKSDSFECSDGFDFDDDRMFNQSLSFDEYDKSSVDLVKKLMRQNYVLTRWYSELASEEMDEDIFISTKALDDDYRNVNRISYINVDECSGGGCQQVPKPFFGLLIVLALAMFRRSFANS